jgi:hypothetical protein
MGRSGGQVLGSQTQERDRLFGRDERIRDDTPVQERQAGDRFTVEERDHHLSRELGRAIQFSQPANGRGVVGVDEAQLDGGRVSCPDPRR